MAFCWFLFLVCSFFLIIQHTGTSGWSFSWRCIS